nr:class I SAM-dependent methyltransferase [uncultured Arsenicibacter sp.]
MPDLFSGHAGLYAQYRIDYPAELYDYLLSFVQGRERAWDSATGNGQVAVVLAEHFGQVDATDISQPQLDKAVQKPNIRYQVSPAEQTPFPDQSFDLITVAQAVHWFDVGAFHQEVRRVGKPGAVIAEWGYGLHRIDEQLDPVILDFYRNRIGPYWDPQRKHIDDRYARLPFAFDNIQTREFSVYRRWTLERYLNYLRTWSSVQTYIRLHEEDEDRHDPVEALGERLQAIWGTGERDIRFPIFLRLGILPQSH